MPPVGGLIYSPLLRFTHPYPSETFVFLGWRGFSCILAVLDVIGGFTWQRGNAVLATGNGLAGVFIGK